MKNNVNASLRLVLASLALTLAVPAIPAFAEPYSSSEMAAARSASEEKIQSLRNREIEELRRVLGRRLPANRRADLFVRLSELYLEAYRAEFLIEGKVHEKRLQEGRESKFIDRSSSKPYLRLGIQASEEVLRTGIPHPKLDQIYYFLGVYHDELEDEKSAVKYFQALAAKYPQSPYAGEAYRAVAESLFEQNKFREALSAYQRARENYKGSALPRLLQKMAWCEYRLKNYEKAISTLKLAISEASRDDRYLNLKDEALRDMALFMTEGGRVDEAIGYFKQVSGNKDFFPSTLEKLGTTYERQAQPAKAIQVYEALLKLAPSSNEAFRVRAKLFELDLRGGREATALQRIHGVKIPEYSDEDETGIAAKNLKVQVRKVATEQHDEFRKKQNRGALQIAEVYYSAYLRQFLEGRDSRKEIPEIQMYLAEVKRELGKSSEAADLYKSVISSKDERYAREAAAFWMGALSDSIRKSAGSTDAAQKVAMEKDFLAASDYVAEQFGAKPEGLEARLNTARILAGGNAKAQKLAVERIESIIKDAPSSSQARTSARLWIQIMEDRLPKKVTSVSKDESVQALVETVEKLKKNAELMASDHRDGKDELRKHFGEIETRLKVGEITEKERSRDYVGAAKGYEEFAAGAKDQAGAEKALSGAVDSYVKSGDYDSAVRVIAGWLKRFKASALAIESLRTTATNAMIVGRFEKAADLFSILGRRNDPSAVDLAGRLYEGTGDLTSAAEEFKFYLNTFKTSKDRGLIALSLAQWYEYSRNDAQASRYYQLCLSEDHDTSAECGARLADLYLRLEDLSQANRTLQRVAGRGGKGKGKKADRSPWVGYARYRLAETMEREKRFQPLQLPDAKLKRGLEERLKFLEALNRNYQTVVEASGPWAIAALNRLASWVLSFADEVDSIAAPPGSTPEQVAGFRKSLKSVSDPLRMQALQTWKTAYQKAVEGELLSAVIPEIADRLFDAGVFPPFRAQGFRDRFRLSGQPADGGTEGRITALERVRKSLNEDTKRVLAWIDYGNLLWGEGKPLLAKIAYERALLLNPKAAAALNNRGVLIASGSGQEDWIRIAEAMSFFRKALEKDELFLAAKFNQGALFNYYRLFSRAKPFWTQVAAVAPQPDVLDGIAIADQGMGSQDSAEKFFLRAKQVGADADRVSVLYHEAVRLSVKEPKKCLSIASKLSDRPIMGFERESVMHLKAYCSRKKEESRK